MNENARPLILIVDDETAVREILKLQLVGEGYDVRLADDPIVAGRSLREAPPDLMLVDISLPYQDGLDFAAALKADAAAPQVPIVFISGNPEVMARALELAAPCLKKPSSATQLIDLVRLALDKPAASRPCRGRRRRLARAAASSPARAMIPRPATSLLFAPGKSNQLRMTVLRRARRRNPDRRR